MAVPHAIEQRLEDLDQALFMPRELSWLSFNERVLQEARSEEVPVIQRLRYLGIFSNNLDEFYRVRVAEVRRLISVTRAGERKRAENLLIDIQKRVVELQAEFTRTQATVLEELSRRNIHLINEQQLDDKQGEFVRRYFRTTVLPELEPILLDKKTPMPTLNDESIYLAIDIAAGDDSYFALVEVPTAQLSRFIEIPRKKGKKGKVFIVLENVIRYCLAEVFRGVIDIESANAYTIKFSRDAELDIDTGFAESLIEKMETSLKLRRKAEAVRFVYDAAMPAHLLKFLADYFNLGKYDSLIGGGRYHNSKDFIDFPNVGPRYLEYKPLPQIPISRLETDEGSIFKKIRDKDILLYFPYHPFDYMTDLLKTAAVDPAVTDIKINLYRVASNSRICDALINAVYNGKKVLAVVELQARFDEAANINWAQRLADNGVEVLFGVPGLKVHSKLILIERRQGKEIHYYSHIGTGNFNEKTARLYTDFSLLTYDQAIGEDVANVFDFLKHNYRRPRYNDLLVSPHTTRSGLYKLINREISNARDGYPASMILKCNNLVDRELAMKLYEASDAGVSIKLIVRGMCSLLPGVKDLSENIEGVSIVDRYLEHPRVYMFYNRGEPRYLIGSADLMTRNLDRRVEVLAPVKDPDAQRTLQDILDQQLNDNIKARVLDAGQTNQVAGKKKHIKIRSQETIHEYLATGKLPRYPKTPATKKAIRRKKRS